jgi:hypothetical protein
MSLAWVPDAVEPIVGWRYWRIEAHGRLTSLGAGRQEWRPGEALRARCRHERLDPHDERWRLVDGGAWMPHAAPHEECVCGVYAARDLRTLRSQRLFGLRVMAAGEVSLWGKVIPGRLGYRAEFAYPKSILALRPLRDERIVMGLEGYGVPVRFVSRREISFSPVLALSRMLQRVVGPPPRTTRRSEQSPPELPASSTPPPL